MEHVIVVCRALALATLLSRAKVLSHLGSTQVRCIIEFLMAFILRIIVGNLPLISPEGIEMLLRWETVH